MTTTRSATNINYLRRVCNESGMSLALIARRADTSPAVIDSVLTGRRNLGLDLAIRLSNVLKIDLIEFLQETRLIPPVTGTSPLQYELLAVFKSMNEQQQKTLIKIAKALAAESTNNVRS